MSKSFNLEMGLYGSADSFDIGHCDYNIKVKADNRLCISVYCKTTNYTVICIGN